MKILLVTFFSDAYNFGQRLQCYALCKTLDKIGIQYDVLTYQHTYDVRKYFSEFNLKYIVHLKDIDNININDYSKILVGSDQFINQLNKKDVSQDVKKVVEFLKSNIGKIPFVSYGMSLGDKNSLTNELSTLLQKFDKVSCREHIFMNSLQNRYIDATYNIDPVFLLDYDEWNSIEKRPESLNSLKPNQFDIEYYVSSAERGIDWMQKSRDEMHLQELKCITLRTRCGTRDATLVQPDEFIWLVKNARMIYTSSFHCIAFSIIFNKRCAVPKHILELHRIKDLISTLNVKFESDGSIQDYQPIIKNIEEERIRGYNALLSYFVSNATVPCGDMQKCSGCMLCKYVCEKSAIISGINDSLHYPVIDFSKCINCGKCKKECPVLVNQIGIESSKNRYIVLGHVQSSTSSGLATVLAKTFIARSNGVVYGVEWGDGCMSAHYRCAVEPEQCNSFKGSKYIDPGEFPYQEVKSYLDRNINVMVFCLPCLAAGLRAMFGWRSTLTIVQLICNCAAKPNYHRACVQDALSEKPNSKVLWINERAHVYDQKKWPNLKKGNRNVILYTSNGMVFQKENQFYKPFRNNSLIRPSCIADAGQCGFQKQQFYGDLVIGDPNKIPSDLLPNGSKMDKSIAIVITENGHNAFNSAIRNSSLSIIEYDGNEYQFPFPSRKIH